MPETTDIPTAHLPRLRQLQRQQQQITQAINSTLQTICEAKGLDASATRHDIQQGVLILPDATQDPTD